MKIEKRQKACPFEACKLTGETQRTKSQLRDQVLTHEGYKALYLARDLP